MHCNATEENTFVIASLEPSSCVRAPVVERQGIISTFMRNVLLCKLAGKAVVEERVVTRYVRGT